MSRETDPQEGLSVQVVEERADDASYRSVRLATARGELACRLYPAAGAGRCVVCVGGTGGGWDTPAHDLYPGLCQEFAAEGIAALRVQFRDAQALAEAVHDVRAGIAYLRQQGGRTFGLVGHSFGGAVVIRAAALEAPAVRTVVTLATQAYGTEPVAGLGPTCSVLLLHGAADRVVAPYSSEVVYDMAQDPKGLILYPGAGHGFDEVADDVHGRVHDWIIAQLPQGLP